MVTTLNTVNPPTKNLVRLKFAIYFKLSLCKNLFSLEF